MTDVSIKMITPRQISFRTWESFFFGWDMLVEDLGEALVLAFTAAGIGEEAPNLKPRVAAPAPTPVPLEDGNRCVALGHGKEGSYYSH